MYHTSFIDSVLDGHVSCFYFLTILNNAAINIFLSGHKVFARTLFLALLYVYLGLEMLGHRVILCLTF